MDEREANIDIVFRNGLKDYEVLPPGEVWENIRPVIRKKQQPYIILRAAAIIAVLVSLSFLAYEWNKEFSTPLADNNSAGIYQAETVTPAISAGNLLADAGDGAVKIPVVYIERPYAVSEVPAPEEEIITEDENITFTLLPGGTSGLKPSITRAGRLTLNPQQPVRAFTGNYLPVETLTENSRNVRSDRWSVAALVSPTYLSSFRTGNDDASDQLKSAEQPLVSYAGGLALSYKVNRRLSVQSGIYYSSYGNEISGITSFSGFQQYDQMKGNNNFEIQTSNGTVYTSNSDVFLIDNLSDSRMISFYDKESFSAAKASLSYLDNSLRQNLGYLELPVIIKYKFIDRGIDFNIIGGLSSNLLVNNSVYASSDGKKYEVAETGDLRMVTFSSSLGMGMEYSFNKNLSLNLEPTFRYFLNPFSSGGSVKIHPYTFGIFSGLSYKF